MSANSKSFLGTADNLMLVSKVFRGSQISLSAPRDRMLDWYWPRQKGSFLD
jgi:hypothetical protein